MSDTIELDPDATDANGRPYRVGAATLGMCHIDLSADLFAHPDQTWTGFAADGLMYEAGVPDLLSRSTWSDGSDGSDMDRSDQRWFPTKALCVATDEELVIYDVTEGLGAAVVWVRFRRAATGETNALGTSSVVLGNIRWSNGVLAVQTSEALVLWDLRADRFWRVTSNQAEYSDQGTFSARNEDEFWIGSVARPELAPTYQVLIPGDILSLTGAAALLAWPAQTRVEPVFVVGHPYGVSVVILQQNQNIEVKQHRTDIEGGTWEILQDAEGVFWFNDTTGPVLRNLQVALGDRINIEDTEYTILEIHSDRRRVRLEGIASTGSGSSYKLMRPVWGAFPIRTEPDRWVLLTTSMIVPVRTELLLGIHDTVKDTTISVHEVEGEARLIDTPEIITGAACNSSVVYVAGTRGIWAADMELLGQLQQQTSYRVYGAAGDTVAHHTILPNPAVRTMTVDQESGSLVALLTQDPEDEGYAVATMVTIHPSLHRVSSIVEDLPHTLVFAWMEG